MKETVIKTTTMDKLHDLENIIASYPSALIAFSGGGDSTLLAYVCKKTIGKDILLVTATSSTYPERELGDAREIAAQLDLPHLVISSEELDIPEFSSNPQDRCYHCKKELFSKLSSIAQERGLSVVFDGNNASDINDFRPGRTAAIDLGIVSPLEKSGLSKNEIRELSRLYNLPTAEKPAMACLASRFPYGETITRDKLSRVEKAENQLRDLGFFQIRVRSHGDLARVEVAENELPQAFSLHSSIADILSACGFTYHCLDLRGYRTGSMNEALSK